MRRSLWVLVLFACSEEPAPQDPASVADSSSGPSLGEWGAKAKASLTALYAADVKTTDAEQACVASRTLLSMGERRSEPGIAELTAEVQKVCLASDAWASLLRLVPDAKGIDKTSYCDTAKSQIKKAGAAGADVTALEDEYSRACEAEVKFDATGALARVPKMDPASDKTIAVCRDARVEALQKTLTDRAAGRAMEKGVDKLCALPDLFSSLKFAADKSKVQLARDSECLAAKVWIDKYSRNKKLKGKSLAAAKKGFKKACAKWARYDQTKELAKIGKMDPKSKEAREACVRAMVFTSAHKEDEGPLEEKRMESCAVVEGWFQALDGACLNAETKLDKLQQKIAPEEFQVMKTEVAARCKSAANP